MNYNDEIIEKLKNGIKYAGEDKDSVSWGMKDGVLISANEAKLFIKLLQKTDNGED